jgi:hypothetical protein
VDGLLVAKLVASPVLIAMVSWVERRFGPAVAGLVAGLPLSSVPVSVFLALEQGVPFAKAAVPGMMAGITAVSAFLLAFAWSAKRLPWWCVLPVALAAYAPAMLFLRWAELPLGWSVALGAATLLGAALLMPSRHGAAVHRPHPAWEVPLRMAVAAAMVVGLTSVAAKLGPRSTGLLGPFPVFSCVVGGFILKRAGPEAAVRLMRGIALGALSYVAYFAVVGSLLGHVGLPWAYGLAAVAAAATSSVVWNVDLRTSKSTTPA